MARHPQAFKWDGQSYNIFKLCSYHMYIHILFVSFVKYAYFSLPLPVGVAYYFSEDFQLWKCNHNVTTTKIKLLETFKI